MVSVASVGKSNTEIEDITCEGNMFSRENSLGTCISLVSIKGVFSNYRGRLSSSKMVLSPRFCD